MQVLSTHLLQQKPSSGMHVARTTNLKYLLISIPLLVVGCFGLNTLINFFCADFTFRTTSCRFPWPTPRPTSLTATTATTAMKRRDNIKQVSSRGKYYYRHGQILAPPKIFRGPRVIIFDIFHSFRAQFCRNNN